MTSLESDPQLNVGTVIQQPPLQRVRKLPRAAFQLLRHNFLASVGTAIVVLFLLMAAIGPVLTPYAFDQLTADIKQPPSLRHLFGTDNFGRDVFSRVVAGSRGIISLAGGWTVIAGIFWKGRGFCAMYEGGWRGEILIWWVVSVIGLSPGVLGP